jgi:hypothetical protein
MPAGIGLLDQRNFPAPAPAFQLLLAHNRVVHVAKVFDPHEPVQMIAFREALNFAKSMLV